SFCRFSLWSKTPAILPHSQITATCPFGNISFGNCQTKRKSHNDIAMVSWLLGPQQPIRYRSRYQDLRSRFHVDVGRSGRDLIETVLTPGHEDKIVPVARQPMRESSTDFPKMLLLQVLSAFAFPYVLRSDHR